MYCKYRIQCKWWCNEMNDGMYDQMKRSCYAGAGEKNLGYDIWHNKKTT